MSELNTVSTNSSDSAKNGGLSNSPEDMDSAAAASHAIKKRQRHLAPAINVVRRKLNVTTKMKRDSARIVKEMETVAVLKGFL